LKALDAALAVEEYSKSESYTAKAAPLHNGLIQYKPGHQICFEK